MTLEPAENDVMSQMPMQIVLSAAESAEIQLFSAAWLRAVGITYVKSTDSEGGNTDP